MKNSYQIRNGDNPKYPFPSYACCSARSSTRFNGPTKKNRATPPHCFSLGGPLVRICQWTPVLFVAVILTWSYYAYVIQFCCLTLPDTSSYHNFTLLPPIAITYIVLFNALFAMLVWSYLSVAYNRFGRRLGPKILARFRLRDSDMARLEIARNENDIRRTLDDFVTQLNPAPTLATVEGGPRFCDACKLIKPDRAHHCAACGRCVLKMDHHCPWVNNCIQYGNYKQFILFLLYGLLLCTFAAATTFPYFLSFWSTTTAAKSYTGTSGRSQELIIGNSSLLSMSGDDGSLARAFFSTRFHVIFLFFVSIMFGISMGALLTYHCYLVTRNRTTLESFRAPIFLTYRSRPDKNGFDLGSRVANFQQVFGQRPLCWPLPIFTGLGDGTFYPTRHDHNNTTIVIPDFDEGDGCPPMGLTLSHNRDRLENWNASPSIDGQSPMHREAAQDTHLLNNSNNHHNLNHTPETTSRTNLIPPTQSTSIEIPMLSLSNETLPIKHPQPMSISPYGSFTLRQAPINIELYAPS